MPASRWAAAVVGFLLGGTGSASWACSSASSLPWLYLKFRHSRRLNAFNGQLAETLGLMAGGLQAGLSLPQAVDSVVREGNEPMAGELRRALVEQRLGVDITDALEGVGERMESEDFGWVVMAIRIQREVGGNLAEILHTVADTLREREYLRRQVKALSAEGRLSGYILTACPSCIVPLHAVRQPGVRRASVHDRDRVHHARRRRGSCWRSGRSPWPSSPRWRSDMSLILLLGAGLLFAGRHTGPVAHRRGHHGTTWRRPLRRRHPGHRQRRPTCSRTSSSGPSPSACIAPLGDRLVGLGRKLVRADTAKKIQYRLNIAGNPPGWDVNRILGLKVLGLGVFGGLGLPLPRSARTGRSTGSSSPPALLAAFGYVLPNILLYNAGQKRETLMRNALPDAHRPAHHLRRGWASASTRPSSRVAKNTDGPARAGVRPPAPGDADRRGPDRRHARHGRTHLARTTSSRSASRWSRPTASASRSPACCASRARRCAPSGASAPRRRRSRCRCGS